MQKKEKRSYYIFLNNKIYTIIIIFLENILLKLLFNLFHIQGHSVFLPLMDHPKQNDV